MKYSASFFQIGKFIYKKRYSIIIGWILVIIACFPIIPHLMTPFKTTGFVDDKSKSVKADHYLNKELGYSNQKILIIYHSNSLKADNSLFIKKIKSSLSDLDQFPIKNEIIYPNANNHQISKDKHSAFVVILFKTSQHLTQENIKTFKSLLKTPSKITMKLGGEPLFIDEVNKLTQKDLYKADLIAAPVSLIILILIFGSIISALVPLILGVSCALTILATLYFLGHLLTLSIFTINIALLLGICLSLDYSLFIITRFKDEMNKKQSIIKSISITMSTAGKAVFFSGLAVFISLSVLLFFPINILFSIGVGGLVAVFIAVIVSILILPAILCVLKHKINLLPVIFFKRKNHNGSSIWRWIAKKVVKRPFIYFCSTLLFLLLLGYPFLSVKFGISDLHMLPTHCESRNFLNEFKNKFNENELTPIILIYSSTKHKILDQKSIANLYDFAEKLKSNSYIKRVNSIVTTNDDLNAKQYYALYKSRFDLNNSSIQTALKTTSGKHFTTLSVVSKYASNSSQTKKLITQLEQMKLQKDWSLQLTGVPVNNAEVLTRISKLFPYALLWIVVLTYLILLILLRSLFLPLKAILMNIISLSASYGVLVYIFQEGHLHQFLNFEPQGIMDSSLVIIIFCALFGFSMDYEVFLLTRIKEYYDQTKNNNKSIVFGIEKSSRIITSAAIIVIVLCGSFMVADVLMVKEFGLGIAVAIFVDAFLVRSLLVPSTMALLNRWNWYLPKWLKKVLHEQ